jgi:hypothetical protein
VRGSTIRIQAVVTTPDRRGDTYVDRHVAGETKAAIEAACALVHPACRVELRKKLGRAVERPDDAIAASVDALDDCGSCCIAMLYPAEIA